MDNNRLQTGSLLLLIFITLLAFGGALQNNFVNFDDSVYVYENPVVQQGISLHGIAWAFSTFTASNWHPVTWLSHMIDVQLLGVSPAPMHFVNVLIHLANALLLVYVLWKFSGNWTRSLLVAALFAVHPLRVESVAWISERKDVLSIFFGLITMLLYSLYAQNRYKPWYFAMLACFALSLMCKPMLVTLPLLLLLLDFWPLNRLNPDVPEAIFRCVVDKLPMLGLSIISCVITFSAQSHAIENATQLDFIDRISHALIAYLQYIEKILWPTQLAVLYPLENEPSMLFAFVCFLILATITGLCIWAAVVNKKYRHAIVGWLWFVGTLVPVIGFVQVGLQQIADRYTYFPCIGLMVVAVWAIPESFFDDAKKIAALSTVVLLILATWIVMTRDQVTVWENSLTLWTQCSNNTANNTLAFSNLGYQLLEKNRHDEARRWLTQAYLVDSKNPNPKVCNDLGQLHDKRDELDMAMIYFNRAIDTKPDFAAPWLNRGKLFQRMNNPEKAQENFKKYTELNPEDAVGWCKLGITLSKLNRLPEAKEALQTSLKLKPGDLDATINLQSVKQQIARSRNNY